MTIIPYVINEGVIHPVPFGSRFDPTDEQLVMYFLSRTVLSFPMLPLPDMVMPEIHISQFDPWNLPGGDEDEKHFYTREEPEVMQRGIRMKGVSVAGVWREISDEPIHSPNDADVVAMKRTYAFYRTRGQQNANWPQASWTLHEFRLVLTETLNHHLLMIAAANHAPLQFTRHYACKVVRRMRSGGRGGGAVEAEMSDVGSSSTS